MEILWTLNEATGVLTLTGEGPMMDYGSGGSPFYSSAEIKKVVVEEGITKLGQCLFQYCSELETVSLPNSLTEIGANAFGNCWKLKEINLPSEMTEIAPSTFSYCSSLTTLVISDKVTSVGSYAFGLCDNLESVIIGSSVGNIYANAFRECNNLKRVYAMPVTPPALTEGSSETFYGIDKKKVTVYVPKDPNTALSQCRGAAVWSDFANIRTFNPDSFVDEDVNPYDVNGDGNVNSVDVVAVYNYIVNGADGNAQDACDLNCYGRVNSVDIVAIYNYIAYGQR